MKGNPSMTRDDFMDHRCPCGRFFRTCPYHGKAPQPKVIVSIPSEKIIKPKK